MEGITLSFETLMVKGSPDINNIQITDGFKDTVGVEWMAFDDVEFVLC